MSLLKGLLKESEDILSKQDESYNSAFLGADLELDGSRRREISLYRNDEIILTVEHGVTLGLLKLIYSSDNKVHGILQGVRSRATSDASSVSSVILSDERVLDRDEYDLIIQESDTIEGNFLQIRNPSHPIPLATPSTSTIFTAHANNNEKKKGQFVCEYCHLPFVSKAKFHRHRRIHTEENPYMCVYCNETFPHHLDLRKHREEQHMMNKPFKCSCCPKTFATRAELRGHLWRHTGEKNHKCRICSKTFATKGNLKLHVDKHIGVHKHKCPFCPQRFTSHSSLEAHMAKHTGLKAYKCRYCTKSYAQAGQLTAHERLHTGEKPFVCEVCGKGFRLNSTRLAHEKRHSGARPHICNTCGRSFAMPDHLRRHMKTHENKLDRVVSCPFCKKKIFQGRNMRKHLFRHRELNLTEMQAKTISASLKPDRHENERDEIDEEQRSQGFACSGKKVLQCQRCNEEVKSIRKLFDHLSGVHYQRELTPAERKEIRLRYGVQKLHHCQFCFSYFMDYRLLRSHMLSEHPEQAEDVGFTAKGSGRGTNASHKCPNCSMFFDLRSTLDEHIIKDHLTTVVRFSSQGNEQMLQFRCWYCSDNFHTPEEVVTHMTNQHESLDVLSKRVEMTEVVSENVSENDVSSTGLWACPHCPVNLKTENEYSNHLALHSQTNEPSKIEGSCTVVRPLVESCPEVHPPDPNAEDVYSYLNSIDGNESETSTECVVKKYLKTDPVTKSCDKSDTSMEMKLSDRNSDNGFGNNTSQVILNTLNPTESIVSGSTIDTTSGVNFDNSSAGMNFTPCVHGISDTTIDSSVDVSSTTTSEVRSTAPNSTVSDVPIPIIDNITTSSEMVLTSDTSLLNSSATIIGGVNTSPAMISNVTFDTSSSGIILPITNLSESRSNTALIQTSSTSLNIPPLEMPYDVADVSSVDFNRNLHVTSTIQVNDSDREKSSVTYLMKGGSTVNQDLLKINTHTPNNNTGISEKRNKSKKKKKNKEKKKRREKIKTEFSRNISCIIMESCRFCSDVFKNKTELNNHIKVAHPNEDSGAVSFRCWFCTVMFTTPEEVVAHMTTAHDNLDNLSRRVEITELKNLIEAEKESCRLKLLKLDDASLSPIDSLKCPKCPRKLESKEAYELHMIVHEAPHNTDLLRTGTDLLHRHRDRNSGNHSSMDEVSLPGDQMNIEDHSANNFTNSNFEIAKPSIMSSSCVSSNSFNKINDGSAHLSATLPKINHSSVPIDVTEKVDISKVPARESILTIKEISAEPSRTDYQLPNKLDKTVDQSVKLDYQPFKKKQRLDASDEKSPSSVKVENTLILDTNITVNMCTHCSRVFCTKRALDVHTFKMHGKEYLQKSQSLRSSTPFNCWFCTAHFPSPELVVDHMTNAHENLDSLSKRIEEQDIPASRSSLMHGKSEKSTSQKSSKPNKFVPIAPQKQMIPIAQLNNSSAQNPVDSNQTPPRGFKMSYALAYVPIYVPERSDKILGDERRNK